MVSEFELRPRVVLVVRSVIINEFGEILLLKRDNERNYASGLWEVPGGKLEEGSDTSHVLEDEVLQETGLVIFPISHLNYVHSEIISSGKFAGLPYVVMTGLSRLESGTVRLSDEHEDFRWVKPKIALDFNLKPDVARAITVLLPQIEKEISGRGQLGD